MPRVREKEHEGSDSCERVISGGFAPLGPSYRSASPVWEVFPEFLAHLFGCGEFAAGGSHQRDALEYETRLAFFGGEFEYVGPKRS